MGICRAAVLAGAIAVLTAIPAAGQQSSNFKITDGVLNAGGRPMNGTVAGSSNFRVTLDAIGDAASATGSISGSFALDSGFAALYLPPGEVENVRFINLINMQWDPEPSVGDYDVYRDVLTNFSGGFGACLLTDVPGTDATDLFVPPVGQATFYLVAARNRLDEAGTLGANGATGLPKVPASYCP